MVVVRDKVEVEGACAGPILGEKRGIIACADDAGAPITLAGAVSSG